MFSWFKSANKESAPTTQQPTWNPDTMTMQQPQHPDAPISERVVSGQPGQQETMQMSLRGGGEGEDVCCGVCAGLACFECCECCC
ncbi:hypothetical protein BO70DRAFT_386810 [Aspergillus heteromorphus CBS 117.55]|uniref:Cysteine-rich transmembrane CYSTM domain-containing protein n=1 Tax=Aspergillus heteromorphus CBS 117.55 TaxID=1448321 RepID=A0A317WE98_9EURO|nr:uncharacterized protein BO70DRAFT_386810 [Aspergillus heteromorphus CBS 117.55]PWY83348.1 hypothetical protein BO70DRAFT_386810 [Aspergillus heteromorphus CBS 117.55]